MILKLDPSLDCCPRHPEKGVFQLLERDDLPPAELVFFGVQGRFIKKSEVEFLKKSKWEDSHRFVFLTEDIRATQVKPPFRTQAGACAAALLEGVDEVYLSVDLQVVAAGYFAGLGSPQPIGLTHLELS